MRFYPDGTNSSSVLGVPCRVYRGWPLPAALNSDLAAGLLNISVFPSPAPDEIACAYANDSYVYQDIPSLRAVVSGNTVSFVGTAASNYALGLLLDGVAFQYQTVGSDSPESIAANFAALIRPVRIALVAGTDINFPGARSLDVRIVARASIARATRRQRKGIQICSWCPSPSQRDAVCQIIEMKLSQSTFIDLADSSKMRAQYLSSQVYDQSQNALLYRRDLVYLCEYTTTAISDAPVMIFGDLVADGTGRVL